MLQYVIRRLLYGIVILFVASFLTFTFVAVTGDPLAPLRITPNVSPETIQNVTERKHLDDSVIVRYGYWVRDAVTNQFGTTLLGEKKVLPDLWRVMKNTLQLVIVAEILAVLLAVAVGVYSALRQYSAFDYSATAFSFLGLAMPLFWLALMLQVAVVYIYQGTGHRIFPIANLSGVDPGTGVSFWIDRAHHLVLPVIVLMVASVAAYSRYMRASMLEVVSSDYVRTARAKGLTERTVVTKHGLRAALTPIVTIFGLDVGLLLGGAVLTETTFEWRGLGFILAEFLESRDFVAVQGIVVLLAVIVALTNFIVDIIAAFIDPRVRY